MFFWQASGDVYSSFIELIQLFDYVKLIGIHTVYTRVLEAKFKGLVISFYRTDGI